MICTILNFSFCVETLHQFCLCTAFVPNGKEKIRKNISYTYGVGY